MMILTYFKALIIKQIKYTSNTAASKNSVYKYHIREHYDIQFIDFNITLD